MRNVVLACLLALPMTLTGCSDLLSKVTQGIAVTQLQFAFDKVELKRVDIPLITPNASADLLVTLKATNPNPVAAALDRISFDVLMDGNQVGTGLLNNGLSVGPNTSGSFGVLVTIPYSGLPGAAMSAIQNRKALVTLRGTSAVSTPLGNIAVPISLSQNVTF